MARYSRAQTEANRERIVVQAARLLRERGLDGVGVADLMAGAGLTHGGFYRHFSSKQELAVEAVEYLSENIAKQWQTAADAARKDGRDGAEAILANYLTDSHRDAISEGCAIAAIGSDLSRLPNDLRERVAAGIQGMLDVLAAELPGDPTRAREQAAAVFGAMVGSLLLSRLGVELPPPLRMAELLLEADTGHRT